jgi:hypothetical protein
MRELVADGALSEGTDLYAALDEAMGHLKPEDRNTLLLRFFEGKEFKAVGAAQGIGEDAARMRVNRALSRLHTLLAARGVSLTVTGLGAVLATEAVGGVPPGLASSIASTALAKAMIGGGAITLNLAKTMILTKTKVTALSAIIIGAFAVYYGQQHHLRAENLGLTKAVENLRSQNTELEQVWKRVTAEPATDRNSELPRLQARALVLQRKLEQAKSRFRVSNASSSANRERVGTADSTPESERVSALSRELHSMQVSIMAFAQESPLSSLYTADQELTPEATKLSPSLDWDNLEVIVPDSPTLLGLSRTNEEEIIGIYRRPILSDNGLWIRTYLLANGSVMSLYGNSPSQVYHSRSEMPLRETTQREP